MKFSIITPCFNAERYIAETIESVLDQTYEDFELIVVDDGSTDRSKEVVRAFTDPRITLLEHGPSGGPSAPRNHGVFSSSGDFVCFLDADDVYLPNRLERVFAAWQLSPGSRFIFHDHAVCDERLLSTNNSWVHSVATADEFSALFNPLAPDVYMTTEALFSFCVLSKPLIHTSTITLNVRADLGCKIRFREDLVCAEDILLWLQVVKLHRGIYIDEPLSQYRDSQESVTDHQPRLDLDTYRYYREVLGAHSGTFSDSEVKELLSRATNDVLSAAWGYFDTDASISMQLAKEAFLFNPSVRTSRFLAKTLGRYVIERMR